MATGSLASGPVPAAPSVGSLPHLPASGPLTLANPGSVIALARLRRSPDAGLDLEEPRRPRPTTYPTCRSLCDDHAPRCDQIGLRPQEEPCR